MNTKSIHYIQPYYKKHLLNLYWLQLLQINSYPSELTSQCTYII